MRLYEIGRGSYSDRQHMIWWGPDDEAVGQSQVYDAVREACPWDATYDGRSDEWGVFWDEEEPGKKFRAAMLRMGWKPAELAGVCIDDVPPSEQEKGVRHG